MTSSNLYGATTSTTDMYKQDILRELIYTKADKMLMGKYACVMKDSKVIDLKFDLPKSTRISSQVVGEYSLADKSRIEFYQVPVSLEKRQTIVTISDESKIRQMANSQLEISLEQAADGLAYDIDTEIFTALNAGAGQTEAASGVWTDDTTNIAADIAAITGDILDNTTMMDTDLQNVVLYYPAKLWGYLKSPMQVGATTIPIRSWLESEYNLNMLPTRKLTNSATVVVKSALTAYHWTYVPDPGEQTVPLVEFARATGRGDEYYINRYSKTMIIPKGEDYTTSDRIGTITGIL